MKKYSLSICIPTYNREKYLNELLESVYSQLEESTTDLVQVCISDNASTDNTDSMIKRWQTDTKLNIVYSKNKINIGPDLNYLKSVSIADGVYCWLMGSDDKIKEGAITYVLNEIKSGYDIYLCNRTECDINMKPEKKRFWLYKKIKDKVFDFTDIKTQEYYFNNSKHLGAVFSYLSCIIVNKKRWSAINYDTKYTGSAYSHVFILLSILTKNGKLKYIYKSLILCRIGNDSFLDKGVLKRYLIDYNGYRMLANDFYSKSPEIKKCFLNILTRERALRSIIYLALVIENDNEKNEADKIIDEFDYSLLVKLLFKITSNIPYKKAFITFLRKVKAIIK